MGKITSPTPPAEINSPFVKMKLVPLLLHNEEGGGRPSVKKKKKNSAPMMMMKKKKNASRVKWDKLYVIC